jgi:hypothetical protein
MGAILKGISVIRGVKPKSNKITKLKASIARNVGESNKLNAKNEEGAEKILEMEKNLGDPERIKKAEENLKEIRDRKLKYPKEAGLASSGDEFIAESEYKKGGLVKKGLPKLAKKGWK